MAERDSPDSSDSSFEVAELRLLSSSMIASSMDSGLVLVFSLFVIPRLLKVNEKKVNVLSGLWIHERSLELLFDDLVTRSAILYNIPATGIWCGFQNVGKELVS